MTRFHKRARLNGAIDLIPFSEKEELERDAEEQAEERKRILQRAHEERSSIRESRIKELTVKSDPTSSERDEFLKLIMERERSRPN